jgi:hypothetical protein
MMLNMGHERLEWTPHFSEIYNSATTIDETGITVGRTRQDSSASYESRMTPNQFNISRINGDHASEIFKADGDSGDMSNAVVAGSMHLGRVVVHNREGRWHFTNAGSNTASVMETFAL